MIENKYKKQITFHENDPDLQDEKIDAYIITRHQNIDGSQIIVLKTDPRPSIQEFIHNEIYGEHPHKNS